MTATLAETSAQAGAPAELPAKGGKAHAGLTQAFLVEALAYDGQAGTFTWRHRPARHFGDDEGVASSFNKQFAGRPAGRAGKNGYLYIHILGTKRLAHRLAWLYVHGTFPLGVIDHINRRRLDNRIANLRSVSRRGNSLNAGDAPRSTNRTSGVRGVTWYVPARGSRCGWKAQIVVHGRSKYLGVFDSIGEAKAAYDSARAEFHDIRSEVRP